jgi:hypothetical protein
MRRIGISSRSAELHPAETKEHLPARTGNTGPEDRPIRGLNGEEKDDAVNPG